MWTSKEERIAARALMSDRSPASRRAWVAAELELEPERAEELLTYASDRQLDKKAQVRAFAEVVTDMGQDMARTTMFLQGGVALGVIAFACLLLSMNQTFLAVVAFGLAAFNLGMAYTQYRRRNTTPTPST